MTLVTVSPTYEVWFQLLCLYLIVQCSLVSAHETNNSVSLFISSLSLIVLHRLHVHQSSHCLHTSNSVAQFISPLAIHNTLLTE